MKKAIAKIVQDEANKGATYEQATAWAKALIESANTQLAKLDPGTRLKLLDQSVGMITLQSHGKQVAMILNLIRPERAESQDGVVER